MTIAEVKLWGKSIGAVSWDAGAGLAHFEYEPDFVRSGVEVAPLTMPLSKRIYSFPALPRETFHGLPGLLADSLPDDFGNALINVWLANQGRTPETFNPVERLCYTGIRGMGALEYLPAQGSFTGKSEPVDVKALVDLASRILTKRNTLQGSFNPELREDSLQDILRVGTSAGGARAKAIIAWNQKTNEVHSGQVKAGQGFSYWLLKFDGVSGNRDKELEDPAGYGLIEHAYYHMAKKAGIDMAESRLLKENGRSHFMTRRFDRTDSGQKIHMQSFCAMEHFDFKKAGAHSYEQALRTIRKLGMPMATIEEQFRRMAFNIIGRNQDDHVKNIAFLMDRSGNWSLSPAFDMTYSYNPQGDWTSQHQMSLNGKRDDFTIEDFKACAKNASMKRGRAEEIVQQVQEAVLQWKRFAGKSGVPPEVADGIAKTHRTAI
ncbi:type II toxin-antitoxin system HipA family toxin [Spiribacter sp. C176]|uniref:Type II toxin-antitoxin system HipA family toxin n=1 Tax=Spiribacter salilacus TaxID=2664894 RepID=A0A6N7QRZ8_9GAMM|nr:type II toxin-antitoxin system HipA family toxin [Spiribacter salilacus]